MSTLISKSPAYIAARNILGDHRKVFESLSDAIGSLKSIYATADFPSDFPTVAARVGLIDVTNDETIPPVGEWPAEFNAAMVAVSFIGVRGLKDEADKEVNGARGFAVYPFHGLDAIRAVEDGEAWLFKLAEKESGHIALRGLRNVAMALGTDALAAAAMSMPVTVADYVEESTSEGLDTTAFDKLWKQFRKMLSESADTAALVPQLPNKNEVLRAIRSTAYAKEEYAPLESIGAFRFIGDTMGNIIDHMRNEAIAAGQEFELDSAEIRGWIAGRDAKVYARPVKAALDPSKIKFEGFASFLKGGADSTAEQPAAGSAS